MCSAKPASRRWWLAIRVRDDGEIDTIGAIKDNLSDEKKAELLHAPGPNQAP